MARKTKMNSITSPELLSQVNKDNQALLRDFLDYLRAVQRSETTINGYENDIQIAWVWCLQNNDNKFLLEVRNEIEKIEHIYCQLKNIIKRNS